MRYFSLLFWVIVGTLLIVKRADAYIDPGTGSYFIQMLLGLALGVMVSAKVLSRRAVYAARSAWKKLRKRGDQTDKAAAAGTKHEGGDSA